MSDPGLAAQLVGRLAYEFAQIQPMLPTYTLITLAAIFPIYVGAHASLSCPSSAVRALKRDGKRTQPGEVDDGDSETESDARMEGMSPSDAIFFPLIAGVMLSALYLLIQYLDDPEVLNKILNWYFAIVGLYSVSKSISDALRLAHRFVFPACYSQGLRVWVVDAAARLVKSKMSTDPETQLRRQPVPGLLAALPYPAFVNNFLWSVRELPSKKLLFKFYIERVASGQFKADVFNGLGVTAALCATAYFNLVDRPWWLTNLMGFAFAYSSLQFISPTTFVTGALVLLGLFCYDIYMVFFTPMMVTVAKSLDIPIKILIPRPPDAADPSRAFGMLGLGDIVLPGFMIGMALRFDLHLHYQRLQRASLAEKGPRPEEGKSDDSRAQNEDGAKVNRTSNAAVKPEYTPPIRHWSSRVWTSSQLLPPTFASGSFRKTYFTMSFLGYVVGMMATEAAMHYANHAQPALLYLVPAVLISLLLAAAVRGELNAMWEYTEEEDEDQEVEEKSGKDVEKKKRRGSSFSPSRSAKVADEIASALSVPEKGAAGKDGDKQPAPPEEQSLPTVRGPAHTFRRDRERDIVFLSVGRTGSWKSRRPRSQRRPAPKWVVPPHEREELNDVVGHAGKRLRMA